MTTTVAVLLEPVFGTPTGASYVSDGCITAIDKITATNEGATVATATVQLLSPDGTQTVSFTKSLAPGTTWSFPDVVGHTINAGGKMNVISPTANAVKFRASGRKFT